MSKKNAKPKVVQTAASASQDIIGLITTLIEKLVTLESKVDTVLSRLSQRSAEPPRHNAPPAASVPHNKNSRPMHSAVCAECGKNCEVPFKPSGDRPVYCQGCFAARKKQSAFNPAQRERPGSVPAAKPAIVAAKKKPAAKKPGKKKK
jgi:CxxC-x17-CxxC domain-containing protein